VAPEATRRRVLAIPGGIKPSVCALLLLALAGVVGFFAFPTYPTYDSFYGLVWGRELLHGHLPHLEVYRAPTEHPLLIAFGALCALAGQDGARLMIAGSIGSYVALVGGMYRLGRLSFGPVVGWLAAALMLTRFFDENLTVQGYLDISYLALIVWAAALEAARPRRGTAVLSLLAAAGLLRPDAWVLAGAYWLWCAWPTRARPLANSERLRWLALALLAPVVWAAFDWLATGDPLHSLHQTTELAGELERAHGLSGVLGSVWGFAVRIDKLPVVIGALAGIVVSLWLAPRRALMPLALLALQLLVFVAEGASGTSVINRYLLGASAVALVFAAVALGGWSMLRRGSRLRVAWMAAAAALAVYGVANVLETFQLSELSTTMAYHEDFHEGLARALADPVVKRALARCGAVSVPDNKLMPDARWILDGDKAVAIVARSQARSEALLGRPALQRRLAAGSVAVYPLGAAVFFEAIVDPGDDPRDQVPAAGFTRIYSGRYYAAYANC
jgi:hypothetical protein